MEFYINFIYEGLEDSGLFGALSELVKAYMKREYVDAYNEYCEIANGGVTDALNEEYSKLNLSYDDSEYNAFMINGYTERILNDLNASGKYGLTFEMGEEVNLVGVYTFVDNKKVKISFTLQPKD